MSRSLAFLSFSHSASRFSHTCWASSLKGTKWFLFEGNQGESGSLSERLLESGCSPVQDVKLSLSFLLQLKLLFNHLLHPGSVSHSPLPPCALQPPVLVLPFQQGCQDLTVRLLEGTEEFKEDVKTPKIYIYISGAHSLNLPVPPALAALFSSTEFDIDGSRNTWWNMNSMNLRPQLYDPTCDELSTERSSLTPSRTSFVFPPPSFSPPPSSPAPTAAPAEPLAPSLDEWPEREREREGGGWCLNLQNPFSHQKNVVHDLYTSSSLSFSSSICLQSSSPLLRSSAFLFSSSCLIRSRASFRVRSYSFSKRLVSSCSATSCCMYQKRWVIYSRCLNFLNYVACWGD